jgi:hypothetical protein
MDMGLAQILKAEYGDVEEEETAGLPEFNTQAELDAYIAKLETEMREAAKKFEFEKAAKLRDSIKELRDKEFLFGCEPNHTPKAYDGWRIARRWEASRSPACVRESSWSHNGSVWQFCSSYRFGAGRLQSAGRSAGVRLIATGQPARISPERLADTARRAGIAGFVAVTAAAFALIWSVFTNDFSITYILEHSNRALPGPTSSPRCGAARRARCCCGRGCWEPTALFCA